MTNKQKVKELQVITKVMICFSYAYGVSQVVPFPNTKRNERVFEAFCSERKFL